MKLKKWALIIMAKEPQAGQTKTRLCPPLTAEKAAKLYHCFLKDIFGMVHNLAIQKPELTPCIGYSPAQAIAYFQREAPGFALIPQNGARLNERLLSVIEQAFNAGYERVAAINSDSPTLPGAYLVEAFERLETADVVLGPCEDGGYYLIGMKRSIPEIIQPVQMSTESVLEETLALVEGNGLSVELLTEWYDVDTVTELERLEQEVMGTQSWTAGWFAGE